MDMNKELEKAFDEGYEQAIEDFAEWVFYYIDKYYFKSKEEMLEEWNN